MINNNLLIVDDEAKLINSIKRVFRKLPYTVFTAGSAREGLSIVEDNNIAVILSDLKMPEKDGLTFFEEVSAAGSDAVQILMTGHATLDSVLAAINRLQLFRCLTKPWNDDELIHTIQSAFETYNLKAENRRLLELTEKQNLELKEFNSELEERVRMRTIMLEEAIHEGVIMLASAAEHKDECTGDHIHRILELTHDICKELGLSNEEAFNISSFSMVHDVGKINIPDDILNKKGVLNAEEWTIMKNHTLAGETILGDKPFYSVAREIARSHHENWDGSGYPDGLVSKEIPLPARIVAVADVFDALISERPYKDAWPVDKTIEVMSDMAGKKFDPGVMEAFLSVINKKNTGIF